MFDGPPIDCDGKINPSAFAVPEAVPTELEELARSLRGSGVDVAGSGEDITSSWAGLSECYTAPEAETLYSALSPVSSSGIVIEMATDRVAGAIEDFAESVRSLKIRWNGLTTRSEAFLAEIADDEDWDEADGFFGDQSENVDKNTALIEEAARLTAEYNEAERTCANKINIGIDGRTEFVEGSEVGANGPAAGEFVYGLDADLSGVPMEWGTPAEVDSSWAVDVGDAVWDFGVGAVEGTGAMVGAHSSEGWFEMSWGDAFFEYHEDNMQSAASLAGMYDAESDSYGWAGGDVAVSAWKDLAHSVVPWEEWGDRPGYVIGTAVLNIGVMAAGAALSATGIGSVVGVPLMAWRGMAILDGMGGRGGSGSGSDGVSGADTGLPANIPGFGGSGSPVFNLDPGLFTSGNATSAQFADMNSALNRLLGTVHDSPSTGGAPEAPRGQPVSDTSDEQPARKPRPNGVGGDSSGESGESGEGAETDPTVQQINDTEGLLDELDRLTGVRNDPENTTDVSPDAKKDPGADWEGGWFAEDMPDLGELTPEQRANTGHGPDEPDRALARVGGDGDGDTLAASRDLPGSAPDARFDLTGVGGERFPETPDDHHDDRSTDLRDDRPGVTNRTETTPSRDEDTPGDRDSARDDSTDLRTTDSSSSDSVSRNGDNSSSDTPSETPHHSSDSDGYPQSEFKEDKDADLQTRKFDGTSRRDINREISQEIELKPDTPHKEFAKRFTDFLNKKIANGEERYFLEFYNSNGSRFRIQREIFGFKIPQLTSINGSAPWFAMETLPEPDTPDYRTLNDRVYFSAESSSNTTSEMDEHAERRREAIKEDLVAEKELKDKREEHKDYPGDHPEVLQADIEHSPLHNRMTKDSETYGEEGAKVAVKDLFDGLHSLPGKDGKNIDLPEIDATEPYKTPGAPKSGNYQFDQIWPLKDGGILIVEAKSSQSTSLGERTIPVGDQPKRVSQGTPEYLEATTEDMKRRAREKPIGEPNELDIAEMIETARAQGKLYYAEVKGITPEQKQKTLGEEPEEGEKHSGYSIGLFEIPRRRAIN
ncbi:MULTISPECIES: hypothetical protein [Nocardiopsis]|uniref:Uncharacterized protein n=1 Tax=Nocardiopsis sinuspersici TaxID=501010 RepID=A0A1V3C456_9ACTN|nr:MULTISPECIES: hypothetical protein [Nocardiopsis]OOC55571.1 hypothetical protein NOSIN_18520 [Nocardiopsis sinuspersici]